MEALIAFQPMCPKCRRLLPSFPQKTPNQTYCVTCSCGWKGQALCLMSLEVFTRVWDSMKNTTPEEE